MRNAVERLLPAEDGGAWPFSETKNTLAVA